MEINIERIKSRFDNKILKEDIVKVYNDFKKINDVLNFKIGLEETICKYFKCKLNIQKIQNEISSRMSEIRGYENELRLLNRNEFDELRGNGKLMMFLNNIDNVKLIKDAYGEKHSIEVAKSRINLNICTDSGASDRIYKVLASGGFLLTDDWEGRELTGLEDKKDLVIYKNLDDLKSKIKHYLEYNKEREQIAKNGLQSVQRLTREAWAKGIVSEK